jgi:hypothetical protein
MWKLLVAGPGFEPGDFLDMSQASRHCSIPASLPWLRRRDSNSHQLVYKTSALFIQLSYAAKILVDREGFKPSTNSLQDCRFIKLSYQPERIWWLREELNLQPHAYETFALAA